MLSFEDISASIAVRHVMTPMKNAVTVSRSDRPTVALELLRDKNFDQAPVVDGDRLVGVVDLHALKTAGSAASLPFQQLTTRLVISANASVGAALPRLQAVPMLFVVDESGIAGFITPSDLNKHPVRTFCWRTSR
jgi:CBS domain containing-hemolysin-like protein